MLIASLLRGHPAGSKQDERPVGQLPDVGQIVPQLHAISVRLFQVVPDDETVLAGIGSERRSSQSANRACKSARSRFGKLAYAASRIRRCRKRNASSSRKSERSGRISSLRASRASRRGRPARSASGRSSASAPVQKVRPTTAARSRRWRSALGRRSSRAARRAPIVGGIGRPGGVRALSERSSAMACVGHVGDELLDEQRVALGRGEDPGTQRPRRELRRELVQQRRRVGFVERVEANQPEGLIGPASLVARPRARDAQR